MRPTTPLNRPSGFIVRPRGEQILPGDKLLDPANVVSHRLTIAHKLVGTLVDDLPLGFTCYMPVHPKPLSLADEQVIKQRLAGQNLPKQNTH
jgi:hypothetical protein